MHCYHCGSPIPEDLKFCPQCGMPMEEQDEPMEQEAAFEEPALADVPEAPAVEELLPADLFEEELENPRPIINDDMMFGLDEAIEIGEDEEKDSTLDPLSPDFDPRKFAGLDQEEFRPISAAELLEEETAEEEPIFEEKKKGRGGIVALVIALIAVILGAAAGLLYWLTEPAKALVVENDFVEYMQLDVDTEVTSFVIEDRETARIKRADTVWCSVTLEDGSTHLECDYVMNYRLTGEGWKLNAVDELNTDSWVLKPMSGASEETVIAALVGQQIKVSDTYTYTLTADDAASTEILAQDTDLEVGLDAVTARVNVVSELVGWSVETELEMVFDTEWQTAAFTHGDVEMEFKPGMEFKLTEEDFAEVLAANPMPMFRDTDDVKTTVVTDGEEAPAAMTAAQTVKLNKANISDLTVVGTAFDLEHNTQTVAMSFVLDKQVAKLKVDAALIYVFEDGWKIDTVEYAPTVDEIVLDGEWKGVYPEVDGRVPGVTLTIEKNEDGTDNNVFAFGPSDTDPYFFTGKYYVAAEADTKTLEVALNATDWVLYYNPGGVTMVDLKGVLLLDEAVITDGQNFRIALQREAAAEEEPVNEDAVAKTVVTKDSIDMNVSAVPESSAGPDVPAETDTPAAPAVSTETEDPAETEVSAEPELPEQTETAAKPEEQEDAGKPEETQTPDKPETDDGEEDDVTLGTWDTPIG